MAYVAYFMHAGQTASRKEWEEEEEKVFYGIDHNGGSVQGKKRGGKSQK